MIGDISNPRSELISETSAEGITHVPIQGLPFPGWRNCNWRHIVSQLITRSIPSNRKWLMTVPTSERISDDALGPNIQFLCENKHHWLSLYFYLFFIHSQCFLYCKTAKLQTVLFYYHYFTSSDGVNSYNVAFEQSRFIHFFSMQKTAVAIL